MKEDFSELVEYLDGKFNAVNKTLDNLSVGFTEIKISKADKTDIESLKEDFNTLQTSVD